MKNPRILITGTYSSFNKGDAAMLIAATKRLKILIPDCRIIVSVPFLEREQAFYSELNVIKSTRRNVRGFVQIFKAWVYSNLNIKLWVNDDEMDEFIATDLVLDISGDGLSEDYGPHVSVSHFLPIRLALVLKKPVFILPQSIGPFRTTKNFAVQHLEKVEMIAAREKLTYQYLESIGISSTRLSLAADLAFLLETSGKTRAENILKNEKINLNSKYTLGITVSNLVEKRFNKNVATKHDFADEIAKLLDNLIDSKDLNIIFVGHVIGPSRSKDDRIIANRIHNKMKNNDKAFVLHGDYRPEDLKAVISMCDVFLGSRMHSNIAALSSSVPTVAISYSQKTDGIMSMLNMTAFVHRIDNLNPKDLAESVLAALDDRQSISQKLESGVKKLKMQAKSSFDPIVNKVEKLQ